MHCTFAGQMVKLRRNPQISNYRCLWPTQLQHRLRRRNGELGSKCWCGEPEFWLFFSWRFTSSQPLPRSFVLSSCPRLEKRLGHQVTVSGATISPFSHVVLRDLKVQCGTLEPFVTAKEARVSYSLSAIIGGNIKVDELALVAPTISLVEQPDGSKILIPF